MKSAKVRSHKKTTEAHEVGVTPIEMSYRELLNLIPPTRWHEVLGGDEVNLKLLDARLSVVQDDHGEIVSLVIVETGERII